MNDLSKVCTSTTETTVATSDEHENLSANQNNFRSFYWLLLVSTVIITIIQKSLLVAVASFLRLLLLFIVHSMKIPFKFFQRLNKPGYIFCYRHPETAYAPQQSPFGFSMLPSPLRKLAREEFVSCFLINFRLSYYNSKYNCDIGPFKADISNRRNYSSQVLLDPLGEEQPVNSQIYNHSCTRDSSSPYTSILQSSSLQHRFKKWQDQRKHKLTASTFSGAIGFWRGRRVQLWLEKLGAKEPFSGNMATCWSNAKEEEALERYKLITGNTILFPRFQVYGKNNLKDDWLAASPDGIIDKYYGLNSRGVLEIKCPFFNGDMKRASPWKRIPLYCIPQAQGLMEILDKDWMDFYVWTPNGSSLFRLYRDEAYWDALKIALSDFWFNHVLPAKELCSKNVITDPLKELGSLKPAPRHELYRYIVYESKHAVDSSHLLMREINGHLQN
ncbi:hypothetical protein NC653_026230 [Populus alba x Populus x berolinensis]|uniref:YqaJ viral recombinase domain-containing protein n=2 Tax=Populus TaxID=3689 RepID=A0AAD6MD98_9ROSI|nr:hypothetical protein NC653_026230 [Populus alba x Populus x berolinensis]